MKTLQYFFNQNKCAVLILFMLISCHTAFSLNISGNVTKGLGTIQFFKDGKRINSTTVLNAGDIVTIYASPETNESLDYLKVNQTSYLSAPVTITIGIENIVCETAFTSKSVFFKETFGELNARTATVVASDTAYVGYDNYDFALYGSVNGGSLIWNTTFGTAGYSIDATDFFLRNSSLSIGLFCSNRIFAHNVQIKFRMIPNTAVFSYIALKATLNDDTTTLKIGNQYVAPVKTIPLFVSPDVTYTHTAPYTVINIPDKGIDLTEVNKLTIKMNTITGYSNRCRIDDVTIVGDSSLSITEVQEFFADPTQKISITKELNSMILSGNILSNSNVKLYDVTGVLIMNSKFVGDKLEISTNKFHSGVYIVSALNKKEELVSIKVVIQ